MIRPTAVSRAATENKIRLIYLPKASSISKLPIMKFKLTPSKIISRAIKRIIN
jgi:hypothetical protein